MPENTTEQKVINKQLTTEELEIFNKKFADLCEELGVDVVIRTSGQLVVNKI